MNFYALLSNSANAAEGGGSRNYATILMIVAMVAVMYFVMIRPQKKKQKEEQSMRDNIQVGDEVTTIGGIMGRVVTVKDDSLIIETGADRNKMKIARWAMQTNNTANDKLEAERQAAKEAAEADKLARMEESRSKSESKRKKTKKNREED